MQTNDYLVVIQGIKDNRKYTFSFIDVAPTSRELLKKINEIIKPYELVYSIKKIT